MKIAAYAHVLRAINPTGVGKHVVHMVREMAQAPGVELEVVAPRQDLEILSRDVNRGAFDGLPLAPIPWPRSLLEKSWTLLRRPAVERWCHQPDWLYCPSEAFVPTRRARLAVTVHCLNWFDPEVPWYPDRETRSTRRRLSMSWGDRKSVV
jgi:hypothetical protein